MCHIHSGRHAQLPGPEDCGHPRSVFAVIRTNLKFDNRAFSVARPREWNSLRASVRQCSSVARFKIENPPMLHVGYYD